MGKIIGLIFTLMAGVFFLVGGFISVKVKNKDKLNRFSVSLAFIIMLDLIFLDLIPEILELNGSVLIILVGIIVGFGILKVIDLFIPEHSHDHSDDVSKMEHDKHIHHIGILTILGIMLHNIIEGFMIYGITLNDIKLGFLTGMSVMLHNIPLGTQIFSFLDMNKDKKSIIFLTLSSLVGGLIFLLVGNIDDIILSFVMAMTLGMIIYIAFFELLQEILKSLNKKETYMGILIGGIILVISILL